MIINFIKNKSSILFVVLSVYFLIIMIIDFLSMQNLFI